MYVDTLEKKLLLTSNINGTCGSIVDLTLSHTLLPVATFNLNLITSCPRSFRRCSNPPPFPNPFPLPYHPPQPLLYTMRYWLHVHICIFWPKDEYRGMSGWYARIDSLHRDNYSDVTPSLTLPPASTPHPFFQPISRHPFHQHFNSFAIFSIHPS